MPELSTKNIPSSGKSPKKRKKRAFPEPLHDTPENIARRCFQAPPKKRWRYQEKSVS